MAGPPIFEESPPARRKGDVIRYGRAYMKSLTFAPVIVVVPTRNAADELRTLHPGCNPD